jgi:hypothetical protein
MIQLVIKERAIISFDKVCHSFFAPLVSNQRCFCRGGCVVLGTACDAKCICRDRRDPGARPLPAAAQPPHGERELCRGAFGRPAHPDPCGVPVLALQTPARAPSSIP